MPQVPKEPDFWPDSFCDESDISCPKFRHPTKGIPVEKMWGALSAPKKGGQTLFLGVFSAWGGWFELILFAMSQISLAPSLDTPQRVSQMRKCGGHFLPPIYLSSKNTLIKPNSICLLNSMLAT